LNNDGKYKEYEIDISKLDTSEQRKLKRRFGNELEDKFGNKIGELKDEEGRNKSVEDYDYLGLKYRVELINDLNWNEMKQLMEYEDNERVRKFKKLASHKVVKEDNVNVISNFEYSTFCKDFKTSDLEKEIIEFKKSFKKEMGQSVKELLDEVKNVYNNINFDTCSIELKNLKNYIKNKFNSYINKNDIKKDYRCLGLVIIEGFNHTFNSQSNALSNKCNMEDEKGAKEIINKLLNYIDYDSDYNMINGKESFFKNQDILFSDESVKKLMENNKN
jgi:hypothetical protein